MVPSIPRTTLENVALIVPGRHLLETDHNSRGEGVPYLTGPSDFGLLKAAATRWTQKPDAMCQPGDVLVTVKGAGVGKINLAPDEPTCIGRQLMAVRARSEKALSEYLYICLLATQSSLKSQAMGATVPGLSIQHLAKIQIPLPPLAEQQQLAGRLREQLAAVADARAALQAQLAATAALPAAHLRELFNSLEKLPRTRLGDVLRQRSDIVHPREQPCGEATFVGLEHIESHTGRRIGSVGMSLDTLTGRKARFFPGDIVYGYLRPYLNKVWLADFDGLCSVDQYVYTVNPAQADAHYVAFFLRSPRYLELAPISATPGQLPRIRTEEVAAVPIPLPPLPRQRALAAELEARFAAIATLRTALEARLAAVERLPAALLREVFDG